MSFKNIKSKNQGFTIVELLIVVVVIAILAAITIVSYNGITNRANASGAKASASTWQKKIELYNSEEGRYPISVSEMSASANSGKSWYITSSSLTPSGAAPTSDNGKSKVQVVSCSNTTTAPTTTTVDGVIISYYNYEATSPNPVTVTLGTCAGSGRSPAASWQS